MKIGDKIYIDQISQSLLDEEAAYTDPEYPNISDILSQIISNKIELVLTRKDDDGTFYYDYMFMDKDNNEQLYVLPIDNDIIWSYAK